MSWLYAIHPLDASEWVSLGADLVRLDCIGWYPSQAKALGTSHATPMYRETLYSSSRPRLLPRCVETLHMILVQYQLTRSSDHCRVMVRVYANLAGLSKAVSKAKLCGAEKRSLAPFVASFNRSNDLFDFVDAGELKENADFKIRAMFVSTLSRFCSKDSLQYFLHMILP